MLVQQKIKTNIILLMFVVCTLLALGLIFVYSSSSFYAIEKYGSPFYYVKKQLFGILLGSIGFMLARALPLEFFKQTSFYLYVATLVLTTLPMLPFLAHRMHGSNRWINIAGFTFQPSELLKVAIVIYLASFLSRKKEHRGSFVKGYLPLIILLAITSLILLKQPDFGCTAVLCATAGMMLFIAEMNLTYLGLLTAVVIPAAGALAYLQPYRWKRITVYLDPWNDPQGAGFQIIQSLIAVGSGGFWGTGIAQSKQKYFYLPMQHTDFIFAIIAEETGFIGSCFLILLFFLFLWFGFRIAHYLKDSFATYLVQGATIIISLQTIINLTVTTGLAPTKGISLPFISYGNSALIAQLILVGLIMNAAQDYYE